MLAQIEMATQGSILAGGSGTHLAPLAAMTSKQLLSICDRIEEIASGLGALRGEAP